MIIHIIIFSECLIINCDIESNQGFVSQNLRLISEKNVGMLHLIANYFLKNHYSYFHLLYECFSKYDCKNFIVQTFNPMQYSIRNACRMDEKRFREEENSFRELNKYPPYADLCVILYKNEIEEKVFNKVDQLYKELLYLAQKYQMNDLEIYSTPPLIYKMFGKYRYNIILK